jgi:hypothetical protein
LKTTDIKILLLNNLTLGIFDQTFHELHGNLLNLLRAKPEVLKEKLPTSRYQNINPEKPFNVKRIVAREIKTNGNIHYDLN